MHPDSAWSPYYAAPAGIDGEPCRHAARRMSVGPTGRKAFWIVVDSCGWCGRIVRTKRDLSWREYDWVRRWNRRIGAIRTV